MPSISVIIPAYNIAGFLPRALDSILNQTFKDIEVIVVDDGSKDDTGKVCDEYAVRDPRVRALHQKNSGAHAARNVAMDNASGKYFYFMDGDDWAEPQMLEDMYRTAQKTEVQLIITGFYIDTYTSEDACWTEIKSLPDAQYTTAESFRRAAAYIFDKNLLYPPWNKLFLAERIRRENIRFQNTRMDDFPFNIDYVRDISSVAVMQKPYYHFTRARAESETARYNPDLFKKREEEHSWLVELYEYWGLYDDPVAEEFLARRYVERIFGCIENVTSKACKMDLAQKRNEIDRIIGCDNTRWSLKRCRPRSLMVKIMLVPLRLRQTSLAWLMGKTIGFVKIHFVGLFARLKAFR